MLPVMLIIDSAPIVKKRMTISALNQSLVTTTRENIYEQFGRLTIPAYIVAGDMDNNVNKHIVNALAIKSHAIHYEEIGESGHCQWPILDQFKWPLTTRRYITLAFSF